MGDLLVRGSAAGAGRSILPCRPEGVLIGERAAEWPHSLRRAAVQPAMCGRGAGASMLDWVCYSAQIEVAYQKLVRMTGATVSLQEFAELYAHDPGSRWASSCASRLASAPGRGPAGRPAVPVKSARPWRAIAPRGC
ncbi:hypothetical protein FJP65_17290 [Stenotrophomonas maltophilia]|nr:hypothetical protein FJP65_17290 [Stenotrophomonas maltophilia]